MTELVTLPTRVMDDGRIKVFYFTRQESTNEKAIRAKLPKRLFANLEDVRLHQTKSGFILTMYLETSEEELNLDDLSREVAVTARSYESKCVFQ